MLNSMFKIFRENDNNMFSDFHAVIQWNLAAL